MKNLILSIGFGVTALAAGALCHRFAPGLGLVLMPMFWPLAALVPAKWSVSTAALMPFAAFLLTGMPAAPVIVALKFALFTCAAAFLCRRVFVRSK